MSKLLSEAEEKELLGTIRQAELLTSGEIRLHIEESCKKCDVLDRAAELFAKLNMHKTDLRNGVLIYVAVTDRKFAIIGDIGINAVVGDGFWDETKNKMIEYFRQERYLEGLKFAVSNAGSKLQQYFPFQKDDKNELSDEISY